MDLGLPGISAHRCAVRHHDAAVDTARAANFFVEISNGTGGFLDLAINVPVKTPASLPPSPFLKVLTDNGMLFSILNDNGSL